MARTGRPREFDREHALDAAMTLFWAQGYEPTSLNQLKAAMGGISPASFYAAFGSKEALFRAVVQRYQQSYGQATASLHDPQLPPRAAIAEALRRSAQMQTDPGHPPGCLMIVGASNCPPEHAHMDDPLAADRARNRAGLEACIHRGIASGELRADTDVGALATAFHTFLMGIATEAKDATPSARLAAAVSALMRLWDLQKA